MRRLVLTLTIALTVTFVVVAGLVALLLVTGEPRPVTNALVEWGLSRAIGTPVRIAGSRGSPLLGIDLEGVQIAPDAEQRFEIERIRIELDSISPLGDGVFLRRLAIEGLRIEGRRSAAGRWSWSAGELDLGATPEAPEAPEDEAPSELQIGIRELRLDDAHLRLEWAGADGEEGWGEARLDGRVRRVGWPLEEALEALPPTELRLSEIRASAGPLSIERGAIELVSRGGSFELTLDDLASPSGVLRAGRARVALRGTTTKPEVDRVTGTLDFTGLDPARFVGVDAPASSLSGRAGLEWDGERTRIELELAPSTVVGIELDAGVAQTLVWREGEQTHYELVHARAQSALATLEASLTGHDDVVSEAVLTARAIDLARWPSETRPDWLESGVASFEAHWRGPWSNPSGELALSVEAARIADLDVESARAEIELADRRRGRVRVLDVAFAGTELAHVRALRPFSFSLQDDAITIEDARIRVDARSGEGGRLDVTGRIARERVDGLRLVVRELSVPALVAMGPPGDTPLELGGRLDAEVEINGPWREPLATGRLDWSAPRWRAVAFDHLRLDLHAAPESPRQRAELSVEAAGAPALEASIALSTRGLVETPALLLDDRSLSINAVLHGIDAATIALLVEAPEPAPTGRLLGRASLRGPLRSPLVEGRAEARQLAWRELPPIDLELDVDATEPSGRARLHVVLIEADRRPLELEIDAADRARLAEPRSLAFLPDTQATLGLDALDLSWADLFARPLGIETTGTASGRLRLESGPVPSAVGALDVETLALEGPGLPFDVGPMDARIDFAGTVARSSELRIASKRGEAALRGQISWDDPSAPVVTVRARAKGFEIDVPGVLVGRFDGDAVVEGPIMSLDADGSFVLYRALIDLPDPQNPIMREIRIRQRDAASAASDPGAEPETGVYDALAGEIGLEIGDSVWLRGLGAELELRGRLAARKARYESAALYGNVEVASGRVEVQGRWLRISSGSASFDGSTDPDPFVDATARHRVGEVTILVRLVGPASDLELELDSEPPLPVEDQLSYLLFDRPAAEISASEAQSVSAAAMAASEMLLGQVGNELGREVGLDRVRLGVDDEDTPYVEVERRVHERVNLRYGRSLSGGGGGDRFVIEWRLFRELFLSGEQQTDGESAVDLFWRRDY